MNQFSIHTNAQFYHPHSSKSFPTTRFSTHFGKAHWRGRFTQLCVVVHNRHIRTKCVAFVSGCAWNERDDINGQMCLSMIITVVNSSGKVLETWWSSVCGEAEDEEEEERELLWPTTGRFSLSHCCGNNRTKNLNIIVDSIVGSPWVCACAWVWMIL